MEPFYNEFYVKVGEKEEKQSGDGGKRKLPPDGNDNEEIRKIPSSLDLPRMIELRKNDSNWKKHFHNKEDSRDDDAGALSIKDAGDNGYDFFINMDNVYLQTEVKGNTKIDHRLLEARFKYGMVLVGISLLDYFEKKESEKSKMEETNDVSMFKKIYQLSKAISPILLPMISSLGDLEIES